MTRYVPVSANAAPIFGGPDNIFHVGYWQSYFYKELHEIDNIAPYQPDVTSPDGGENIGSRYFTITWMEASPTDPNVPDGDYVVYRLEYSTDGGSTWTQAVNNLGQPLTGISEGTTSAVWDLGAIPDTTRGRIRICAFDTYGESACNISASNFTISGGSCF